MAQYYIFGLQRSGTNYMAQLMRLNFRANLVNAYPETWKHSIKVPASLHPAVPILIIHKNPYTWVESLCFRNRVDWCSGQKNYPCGAKGGTDEIMVNGINIVSLAKAYRDFIHTWVESQNHVTIRYEDLLIEENRLVALDRIGRKFSFKHTKPTWTNVAPGNVPQSKDYNEMREKYYIEGFPTNLEDFQTAKITEVIGADNIAVLGYTPLFA